MDPTHVHLSYVPTLTEKAIVQYPSRVHVCLCIVGYFEPRWRRRGCSRRTAGQSERTRSHWTLRTQVWSVFFSTTKERGSIENWERVASLDLDRRTTAMTPGLINTTILLGSRPFSWIQRSNPFSTQLNSTENYGRRCLTPLSPHRNYILS